MALSRSKPNPLKNALPFELPVRELDVEIAELRAQSVKDAAGGAAGGSGGGAGEKSGEGVKDTPEILEVVQRRDVLLAEMQANLTVWQRIQLSRHIERPITSDYIEQLFTDVVELHGDRHFGDDQAIFAGFATMKDGRRIVLVAHRKGRTTEERIETNWGCAHPEGYRKAMRVMQLGEKLGLPIVTLINTPGAYPGIGAEERGQASAIAWNILEMSRLRVPVVSVVIGEGGSGGALGIGVCDRLLVLENSYYSVISPEGCASILWKDGTRGEEAANALKLDTEFLVKLGLADERIPEPMGGAHRDIVATLSAVDQALQQQLTELVALSVAELLAQREQRYRNIGSFTGV